MTAQRFPWNGLMGLGLGVLRLPPSAFWAMTPRELMAAAQGAGLIAPWREAPSRARLNELMELYPDGDAANDRHG